MDITVNGSSRATPERVSVSALIEDLGLRERRLAVEVNEEVVPRSQYDVFVLGPGDRVEIIQAIGGG